ncbi:MAG: quinol:cytochrome C oxidoreductase [Flavobacteriales bacterium]|nr:quinol:cytochrome C oxidoreductase [Flavobacteriales bacterium]
MYIFSQKLKTLSFVLMAVGILSLAFGFITTPSTVEDVNNQMEHVDADHSEDSDSHETAVKINDHHDEAHAEHVLTQLKNRPWSALYVSALFFLFIALGTLFFMAIQYIGQAGWSVVLLRVMEAMSTYLIPGGLIVFLILLAGGLHFHHIFHWMDASLIDPNSPNFDPIIEGKSGYLNVPFFLLRAVVYLGGWIGALLLIKKYSIEQENAEVGNNIAYNKAFKVSAIFMVFFGVTSSTGSWDWVMSVDPHWFSTLFGWYVFSGMFVSALAMMVLVVVYLKTKGYLQTVNHSHIHDLGKFMFGFSIFWTYLWFSQFVLYWYANIPEEVTYYIARFADYKVAFWTMVVMNFVFPLIVLMDSGKKSYYPYMVVTGVVLIIGHYMDLFIMIMPGSVGSHWYFGVVEIGTFLGFLGLFIFCTANNLSKRSLIAKGHPMLKESEHYHYYNIEHEDH